MGRDGFWLHCLLTAHGISAYVLEPTSILVNRRARRAKTDRLDAEGRLRIENRIEALLFTSGIRGRPLLRSWERDVAALRTGDGRALPPLLRTELDCLRCQLVLMLELIRKLEAARADALDTAEAADTIVGKITVLQRIHGIGENFAAVLSREVFNRLFGNRRQLRRDHTYAVSERRNGP